MNIGLFGGSFNPIHNGHVRLAKALLGAAGLDEVWFLVSPQNPLKQQSELLDDSLRLEMARLALVDEPRLKASDFEFHLPRPSYTWNTLQALKREYPEDTFTLLIGGDNWEHFDRWYRHEDILRDFPIFVYPRQDASSTPSSPSASIPPPTSPPSGGRGTSFPLIDISSTMIRERIRQGKDIRRLVPAAVATMIEQQNLYKG